LRYCGGESFHGSDVSRGLFGDGGFDAVDDVTDVGVGDVWACGKAETYGEK
jgi:hypothetical protein